MNLRRVGFWAFLFCILLLAVMLTESKRPGFVIIEETPLERVFDLKPEDIKIIKIVFDGKEAELIRRQGGWKVTKPAETDLRDEQIESLVSSVTTLVVAEEIEINPENISQYGFETPHASIFVEGKDRKQTLLIGDMTPTATSMYALIKEENRVIQIGNFIRFSMRTFIDNVY